MRTTNKGFTLIEIMLLVLIIAIISLYAIMSVRRTENVVAEQVTAVAMKQWLEAGLAYFVEYDKWPTSTNDVITANFLPPNSDCSPWTGTGGGAACPNRKPYVLTQEQMYLKVSITVDNASLAKRIQHQLPGSQVINGSTVFATISLPITGWLVAGGLINHDQSLYLPNCPEGYEGHFILSPQYFTTGWASSNYPLCPDEATTTRLGSSQLFSSRDVNYYNNVNTTSSNANATRAYFLTFCVPNGQWTATSWHRREDGQCGGAWNDYNRSSSNPYIRDCF